MEDFLSQYLSWGGFYWCGDKESSAASICQLHNLYFSTESETNIAAYSLIKNDMILIKIRSRIKNDTIWINPLSEGMY